MGQDPPNLQSLVRSGFIPRAQKALKGVKQAGQDGARAGQDGMHLRKHLWTAFQRRTEKNLPPSCSGGAPSDGKHRCHRPVSG